MIEPLTAGGYATCLQSACRRRLNFTKGRAEESWRCISYLRLSIEFFKGVKALKRPCWVGGLDRKLASPLPWGKDGGAFVSWGGKGALVSWGGKGALVTWGRKGAVVTWGGKGAILYWGWKGALMPWGDPSLAVREVLLGRVTEVSTS